ncbi:hypothetical protein PFISCL1PPCAC_25583, partial [Pristionchus fissidentatus]
ASPSTLLKISMRDKECSFWLDRDQKTLIIEKNLDKPISAVEVKLTRESDYEILSSVLLPIRSPLLPLLSFHSVSINGFL